MIPLPKPRGFWDYALFALMMTGLLMPLFWLEATDSFGWTDAALAGTASVLLVFAIILARRGEKAKWIARPTWRAQVFIALGATTFFVGVLYADGYVLHRRNLTFYELRHDLVPVILAFAGILWALRRRFRAKPQVL